MPFYEITIGNLYKVWNVRMTVDASDENILFNECLVHSENQVRIVGRRLNIIDVPLFEKVAHVSKTNLEGFLEARMEKELLTIDALQRMCERNHIRYEQSGLRLVTAYRNNIKQQRDTEEKRKDAGWRLCQKAWLRTHGRTPGIPVNIEMAIRLLEEAISLGYLPAYGQLSKLFRNQGHIRDAVKIAEKGIKRDDAESMIILADMLSHDAETDAPKVDYKRAAELYIKACEKGYHYRATPGLRRLISRGQYTPKSNQYMILIMYAAKRANHLKQTLHNDHFFDPEVRVAMNMVADGCKDEIEINKILVHAVEENGKTWAYGYLTESYMRLQQWGKAAHTAMLGVETGVRACFFHAARLAEMGADLSGKSNTLGVPDHERALRLAVKSIEEDDSRGFVMLNHLLEEAKVELPEDIVLRLKDFNARTKDERHKCLAYYTIDGHIKKVEK